MESPARTSLWYLLRADSAEAQRARRRLAVGSAFAVFLGGLLTAAGLAIVVFATSLAVVLLVSGISTLRAFRRNRQQLRRFGGSVLASANRDLHTHARRCVHLVGASTSHVRASVARWNAARVEKPIDLQREALRLNAAGTRHRRSGAHADAIELHRKALEVLREAHDPHAVALTQNNLALALSHVGEDQSATQLFEQAAAAVHALGDDEHEGRIMANLALAHRRHGRPEECEHALRLAMTKLRQGSSAYRRVEAELTRVV